MSYPHKKVDDFAQQFWEEQQIYKVENQSEKPKFYVLDMFPYPSGAGLHVGHPLGYIASDIVSRYKRQNGFNVLHPMGFDAFGLPAEQYAIQTGQHPRDTTDQNIARYKEQLKKIGFCYDWSREFRTSDPDYYKWTQWIFSQLFSSYYDNKTQKAQPIEQLIQHFEQSGTANIDVAQTQALNFSAQDWAGYAKNKRDEILMNYRLAYTDYSMVNWCQELGTVLANDEVVNGKSERGGFLVERRPMRQWFLRITAYADRLLESLNHLDWSDSMKEMQRNWIGKSEGALINFKTEEGKNLKVFTTRPDTIFGVTFMVVAPEHEMLEELTTMERSEAVDEYVEYVKSRTDVERQQEKKVSGEFTGSYAIHPFTNKKIPIYVSEYILIGYGTGAIMAVPSDDDRDEAFAKKFGLDIIEVVDKSEHENATAAQKVGKLVNSDFLNGLEVKDAIAKAIDQVEEQEVGERTTNYRLRDAGFSRQRYWGEPFPILYKKGNAELINELPVKLPEVDSYQPTGDGKSPLAHAEEWMVVGDDIRETDTMPGYAGSSWYFLRYMDPNNKDRFVGKDAEQYWQNVDLYIGGTEHAVGHLMYSRFWQKFLFDLGLVSQNEPFKKLVNQGMIQGRSLFLDLSDREMRVPIQFADRDDRINKEQWEKAKAFDGRLAEVDESELNWQSENGAEFLQLRPDIEKMSKSKFNVVNPDEIIDEYGADVFRMFEMFLGPIDQHKPWDTKGIDGVAKFLRKFWTMFYNEENELDLNDEEPTKEELKIVHHCIKKVREDIERLSFNTCVSAFMIATNELTSLNCKKRKVLEPLVALISPFAPHTAEQIWQDLGNETSVVDAVYPEVIEDYLIEDEIEYPVSINGKMRTKINLANGIAQDAAKEIVLSNDVVKKWVEDKPIKKFIFVPNRIVNIVV